MQVKLIGYFSELGCQVCIFAPNWQKRKGFLYFHELSGGPREEAATKKQPKGAWQEL